MKENLKLRKKILKDIYITGFPCKSQKDEFSNSKVYYILKKLNEKKFFTKERYILNLTHFNLEKFAWIFVSINWIELSEEEVMKKLSKFSYVHTIADVTGGYDIAIKIIGRDFSQLNKFIFEIEKELSSALNDVKIYYLNEDLKSHYQILNNTKNIDLKEIDKYLIVEKNKNPKITLNEIGKIHRYHRNTLSKRWHELCKNKVILKKTIELTHAGYKFIDKGLKAFIILHTYPGKREKIIKNLIEEELISDVFSVISNGIVAIVRVEDSQELSYIHKKISKFNDIKKTETIIFLTKQTKSEINPKDFLNLLGDK